MVSRVLDLGERWRRARVAALRQLAPEGQLLGEASSKSEDEACRRVFDNSLRLGRSFVRYHGLKLSLGDLPEALAAMDVPCLQGTFREAEGEPALYLSRSGCAVGMGGSCSGGSCDFYREAIAGLVLGLTGDVRHTRHESLGHGGERCVDLFYEDPESPLRFGEIPEAIRGDLESVRRIARAFDGTADVRFLGISEGALLYEISKGEGGGGVSVKSLVERSVQRKLPALVPVEISPRPVMMGDPPYPPQPARADPP